MDNLFKSPGLRTLPTHRRPRVRDVARVIPAIVNHGWLSQRWSDLARAVENLRCVHADLVAIQRNGRPVGVALKNMARRKFGLSRDGQSIMYLRFVNDEGRGWRFESVGGFSQINVQRTGAKRVLGEIVLDATGVIHAMGRGSEEGDIAQFVGRAGVGHKGGLEQENKTDTVPQRKSIARCVD